MHVLECVYMCARACVFVCVCVCVCVYVCVFKNIVHYKGRFREKEIVANFLTPVGFLVKKSGQRTIDRVYMVKRYSDIRAI